MDIGEATRLLKAGHKVAREGWNGKGMYIFLQDINALRIGIPDQSDPPPRAIFMRTAQMSLVAWTCSQSDQLADDWVDLGRYVQGF